MYTERKHVGVAGKEPMLVPDNDIVAKVSPIKFHRDNLPVGSRDDGIALAIGGKVNSLVDVILAGKGILILAEIHGNMADAALDGPDAGNFR